MHHIKNLYTAAGNKFFWSAGVTCTIKAMMHCKSSNLSMGGYQVVTRVYLCSNTWYGTGDSGGTICYILYPNKDDFAMHGVSGRE